MTFTLCIGPDDGEDYTSFHEAHSAAWRDADMRREPFPAFRKIDGRAWRGGVSDRYLIVRRNGER